MPRAKPTRMMLSVGCRPFLFRCVADGWEVEVVGQTLQFRRTADAYLSWQVYLVGSAEPVARGQNMAQALVTAMEYLESQPAPGD